MNLHISMFLYYSLIYVDKIRFLENSYNVSLCLGMSVAKQFEFLNMSRRNLCLATLTKPLSQEAC